MNIKNFLTGILVLLLLIIVSCAVNAGPINENLTLRENISSNAILSFYIDRITDLSFVKNLLSSTSVGSKAIRDIFTIISVFSFWLFIIAVVFEMFNIVIFNHGNLAMVVMKMVIVSILLASYFPMVGNFVNGVNYFVNRTIGSNLQGSALHALSKLNALENEFIENEKKADSNFEEGKKNVFQNIVDYFKNAGKNLVDGFFTIIDQIIKAMILGVSISITTLILTICIMVRNWNLLLLIVTGPLAIISILLPGSFNVFKTWLINLMYIVLWPVLIGFIFAIESTLMDTIFGPPNNLDLNSFINFWVSIGHLIVLLVLLTSSFGIIPSILGGAINAGGTAAAIMGTSFMMMRSFSSQHSKPKLDQKLPPTDGSSSGGTNDSPGNPPPPGGGAGGARLTNNQNTTPVISQNGTRQRNESNSSFTESKSRSHRNMENMGNRIKENVRKLNPYYIPELSKSDVEKNYDKMNKEKEMNA